MFVYTFVHRVIAIICARSGPVMKKLVLLLVCLFIYSLPQAQEVYNHISNKSIYSFIDELAAAHIIDVPTSVKPYSRLFIAKQLEVAEGVQERLNPRQRKELVFYLQDFGKELFPGKDFRKRLDMLYYKDTLFALTVNPIGGIQYWTNSNGSNFHRWNGAEAFAYIGNHWGFYASLRDNHEKEKLAEPAYVTQRIGGAYKATYDYSEMRGGITYSWKWGSVGLVKDHFSWGDNYNGSNIYSGRTPSYTHIKLHLNPTDWFEFNYMHGWLVSEVVDSARSYFYNNLGEERERVVYKEKYIATNYFTFKPWSRFYFSFGNSIVYSDNGFEPSYLIPLFFFKSIDHTLNNNIDNQNSQMFFNISSRQINNLHLYSSIFVDEVSIGRMFKKETHSNFYSWKAGVKIYNFPIDNFYTTLEYTRTNPLTYQHYIPVLTFESNRFNLGHYLRDNAQEIFLSMNYRPLRGLDIKLSYLLAQKGPDYDSETTERLGLPFMESVEWQKQTIHLKTTYQLIHDGYLFFEFINSNITGAVSSYTPELFYGKTNSFSIGLNFGF